MPDDKMREKMGLKPVARIRDDMDDLNYVQGYPRSEPGIQGGKDQKSSQHADPKDKSGRHLIDAHPWKPMGRKS